MIKANWIGWTKLNYVDLVSIKIPRITLFVFCISVGFFFLTTTAVQAITYSPGETLDPSCSPTDSSCNVSTTTSAVSATSVTSSALTAYNVSLGTVTATGTVTMSTLNSGNVTASALTSGTVTAGGYTATSSCYAFGGSCVRAGRTFYIDSVNGNDSNTGTSSTTPWRTIAKISSFGIREGDVIYLARGSEWREELKIVSDNVTVEAYGQGGMPTLNASDLVTSWSKTDGFSNIYEATITADANTVWINVFEDGSFLTRESSQASVDSSPGTYIVTAETGVLTVYIHPSDSGNPSSNSKVYEVTVRKTGLDMGYNGSRYTSGAIVKGIKTVNEAGGSGSLSVGVNAYIENSRADNGGKHNILIGSGTIIDTSMNGYYWGGQGAIPLTFYVNTDSSGLSAYFEGVSVVASTTGDIGGGISGHSGGSGKYEKYTCMGCRIESGGYTAPLDVKLTELINSTAIGTPALEGPVLSIQGDAKIRGGKYLGWRTLMINVADKHVTVDGAQIFTHTAGQSPIYIATAGSSGTTTLDIRNSVIGGESVQAGYGISLVAATQSSISSYGNTFIGTAKAYSLPAITGLYEFNSDNNNFAGVSGIGSGFTINNVDMSLPVWRTQTNEDANSYVGKSLWTDLGNSVIEYQGIASTSQIRLPNTVSSLINGLQAIGGIYMGGTRFLHNFGSVQSVYAGPSSGNYTLSGTRNTALGYNTLASLTTGGSNVAVGFSSCQGITQGTQNICIGYESGTTFTTGSTNILIGYSAGSGLTGGAASNLILASSGAVPTLSGSNQMNIGNIIFGTSVNSSQSNSILNGRIGVGTTSPASRFDLVGGNNASIPLFTVSHVASSVLTTDFTIDSAGNVGVGTTPTYQLQLSTDSAGKPNGGSWANSSDKRLKKDIVEVDGDVALELINKLKPVTYKWINPDIHGGDTGTRYGFIAQDVQELFPDWVKTIKASGKDVDLVGSEQTSLSLSLPFDFDSLIVSVLKKQQQQISSSTASIELLSNQIQLALKNATSSISQIHIDELLVSGAMEVSGHVVFDTDTVGEVEIYSGSKSSRVTFDNKYVNKPMVVVSPQKMVVGSYWISDITSSGFTVQLENVQSEDVLFTWHSFAKKNLSINELITTTVVDNGNGEDTYTFSSTTTSTTTDLADFPMATSTVEDQVSSTTVSFPTIDGTQLPSEVIDDQKLINDEVLDPVVMDEESQLLEQSDAVVDPIVLDIITNN